MRHANSMNRETKKGMLVFLVVIVAILVICFVNLLYEQSHPFSYQEHLDDAVLSIDDQEISLREFGYYICEMESYVQKQAILYHASDPADYWNTHFSAGKNSTFVKSMAKQTAFDNCICDVIYENMADSAGYVLTSEEEKKAIENAEEFYQNLTQDQISRTGLTQEIVVTIEKRKRLVNQFASDYSKTVDLTGYSGYADQLLSGSGEYFKNNILNLNKVELNSTICDKLEFGRISVNQIFEKNN